MSDNEIRIAIAEACGWKKVFIGGGVVRGYSPTRNNEHDYDLAPDYIHDLNAMHEAEKVLKSSYPKFIE